MNNVYNTHKYIETKYKKGNRYPSFSWGAGSNRYSPFRKANGKCQKLRSMEWKLYGWRWDRDGALCIHPAHGPITDRYNHRFLKANTNTYTQKSNKIQWATNTREKQNKKKRSEELTNGKVQKFWVAEFWARNATKFCTAREVDRTQSFKRGRGMRLKINRSSSVI